MHWGEFFRHSNQLQPTHTLTMLNILTGRHFPVKLWQRNYYEYIIRDEHELNRIRKYILQNPAKWDLDQENPIIYPMPPSDLNVYHVR